MIEDPDGVERDGNGRSAPTDKKSSLIARLREEANVTIHNIDDQEIACCPMWTKGVLDDLAKLMNEAADALSASSAGEGRETMLLALIELVRNHPEFDQGGPMADAMDQALRGETPKLLVDAAYLREGRKPPTDTRSATTSIMDRVRLLEALLSEAVRLLKLDGVIFDPTDCIKQSERALKASTPDRNVSE